MRNFTHFASVELLFYTIYFLLIFVNKLIAKEWFNKTANMY